MSSDTILSIVAGFSVCFSLLLIVSFPLAALFIVKSDRKTVAEKPLDDRKSKKFIVPGEGVFTMHEKRKAHYIDEQKEWAKEQNELER